MFKVIKQEGRARRGQFSCAHGGVVQTPVFMNVGTQGAIKGAISAHDLKDLKCQIELSNTYHLHLRPGDDVVKALGGLRGVPGVLTGGTAENHRGGRYLCLSYRWTADLYGAGGVYADTVPSGQRYRHGV